VRHKVVRTNERGKGVCGALQCVPSDICVNDVREKSENNSRVTGKNKKGETGVPSDQGKKGAVIGGLGAQAS